MRVDAVDNTARAPSRTKTPELFQPFPVTGDLKALGLFNNQLSRGEPR